MSYTTICRLPFAPVCKYNPYSWLEIYSNQAIKSLFTQYFQYHYFAIKSQNVCITTTKINIYIQFAHQKLRLYKIKTQELITKDLRNKLDCKNHVFRSAQPLWQNRYMHTQTHQQQRYSITFIMYYFVIVVFSWGFLSLEATM